MGSVAYLYKHRRGERPISLSKVSVILANLALWAAVIVGLAIMAH